MDNQDRPVEIKDLNKTQLILLAILLSFVVSIATGIVTVTLMQQATPAVNQTINRVVQRTIEKVVPDYSPTKTQTVVVKEDDMVVDAVSTTRANFADVFADKDATKPLASAYSVGNGVFLLPSVTIDLAKTYMVKEGTLSFEAKVSATSPLGFSLLSATTPDASLKTLPKAAFGKDADIKAGQTVVLVGGGSIQKGIVESVASTISINPDPTASFVGAVVVNLDGNVIGFVVPKGESGASVITVDAISSFIANPLKPEPVATTP